VVARLAPFAASAARLVAAHGGDDGYTVTIEDPNVTDALATGAQTTDPRRFTVPCTVPTPYAPQLVDGTRVIAGDAAVFIDPDDPLVTFTPELDMLATVQGPMLPADGVQYVVRGAPRHAGALELHLRGATAAPEGY
jgi:hypothetical protein